MAGPSFDDFLVQVDHLFHHPHIAYVHSVAIGRREAVDSWGVMKSTAADVGLGLVGLEGDDSDENYLVLSVSLFGPNGEAMGRIEWNKPGTGHGHERGLIRRCLWWCVPRRLPLALLHERSAISSFLFDAAPTALLEDWDNRYPLGVPTHHLGVARRAEAMAEDGWSLQAGTSGWRLIMNAAPNVLLRTTEELAGRVAGLFGKQTTLSEGIVTTVDVGPAGLRIVVTDNRRPKSDRWFPITDIGGFGVIDTGNEAPLLIFSGTKTETFWAGGAGAGQRHAGPSRRLYYVLISALLGAG